MDDLLKERYQKKRIHHWDKVTERKSVDDRFGAYYQKLLIDYYKFLIPKGKRVLELGCGLGDLLESVEPSFGVGVDFSGEMIKKAFDRHPDLLFLQADVQDVTFKEPFDIIILSDLVNDLWDVQAVLRGIKKNCHPGTRVIINFYNNIWRIPLGIVKRFGLGADVLEQNWFSPNDLMNLLSLEGFEVLCNNPKILMPLRMRLLSRLANCYLSNMQPFSWFALSNFMIARPLMTKEDAAKAEKPFVSVVVAARNEAGNIDNIFQRVPDMGRETELLFVEGNSTDNTYDVINETIKKYPERKARLFRQPGKGKGDAVRLGFEKANGDILMILDADLTVQPEDLPRFVGALTSGKGEFINGVRLVYPMEDKAMRFFNILGNKFFSLVFTWLLGQPIKDTLCGTKVLYKRDYTNIADNRKYFGDFDPFGDFDLLFGAAKLNFKIVEIPVRYQERRYGDTNISRWKHGWLLLKMVIFAARRIKFI